MTMTELCLWFRMTDILSIKWLTEFCISHQTEWRTQTKQVEEKKVTSGALDYKEQKRLEAQKRKTLNRFAKVEDEIAQVEEQIEQKNNELAMPEVATDYVKASEITKEVDALNTKLDELYAEWEELQTEIEENEYI